MRVFWVVVPLLPHQQIAMKMVASLAPWLSVDSGPCLAKERKGRLATQSGSWRRRSKTEMLSKASMHCASCITRAQLISISFVYALVSTPTRLRWNESSVSTKATTSWEIGRSMKSPERLVCVMNCTEPLEPVLIKTCESVCGAWAALLSPKVLPTLGGTDLTSCLSFFPVLGATHSTRASRAS